MRHQLEYLAVKSVDSAVRPLPLSAVRRLGERLGLAFYVADRVHRRIAIANLEAAFPARTSEDREAIAKAMFKHFGRLVEKLKRVRIGFLELGPIKPGQLRHLTPEEVGRFQKLIRREASKHE